MTRTRTHSIQPDFTVYDLASKNAQVFSDRIAVVEGKDRLTFGQFLELVNRLSAGLRKEGIKHGDRIAILSKNNLKYFALFGIEKYVMRLSLHSKEGLGKKYIDNERLWLKTEDMVRRAMRNGNVPFVEAADEAAFYGPKVDVQVWSVIGKEFSLATNQVDFAQPERFGLKFINKQGLEEVPLCIHRAPLSTHERLIGFLLEHYAGSFPVWLSPEQVRVIPITDSQNEYAQGIVKELRAQRVRVSADISAQRMNAKIRAAQLMKVPYMLVVGEDEMKAGKVALRQRDGKQEKGLALAEFTARVKDKIATRAPEL